MARFYGIVGYGIPVESPAGSGVWVDNIVEKSYYGEVLKNFRRYDSAEKKVNPDLNVSNTISIVADQYAIEHFHYMKYIEFEGVKWTVNTVEVMRPRLKLWLGRVYNGS